MSTEALYCDALMATPSLVRSSAAAFGAPMAAFTLGGGNLFGAQAIVAL